MRRTINILGTKYIVCTDVPQHKDKDLENRFGYCTPTMKKIVTVDLDTVGEWKNETYYSYC